MTTFFFSIVFIALILFYVWYARIISKHNSAKSALSTIDVQLKMRSDLIPNILTIANKFMAHEKSLLVGITELRVKADEPYDKSNADAIKEHLMVANELATRMGQLKIAVENYPVLKSDQTMITAMETYNEVEAQIAAARRFYNSAVTQLNNAIQIFPGTIIAPRISIKEMPFYTADENAKQAIDAKQFFS